MRWPWRSEFNTVTVAAPSEPAWPTLLPPDLEEWFPVARVCVVGGAMYVIAIASCARCGAAVALYDQGDFSHLYRHIEFHQLHTR